MKHILSMMLFALVAVAMGCTQELGDYVAGHVRCSTANVRDVFWLCDIDYNSLPQTGREIVNLRPRAPTCGTLFCGDTRAVAEQEAKRFADQANWPQVRCVYGGINLLTVGENIDGPDPFGGGCIKFNDCRKALETCQYPTNAGYRPQGDCCDGLVCAVLSTDEEDEPAARCCAPQTAACASDEECCDRSYDPNVSCLSGRCVYTCFPHATAGGDGTPCSMDEECLSCICDDLSHQCEATGSNACVPGPGQSFDACEIDSDCASCSCDELFASCN